MSFRRLIKKHLGRGDKGSPVPPTKAPGGSSRIEASPVVAGPTLSDDELPKAAIVILNYNGRRHLEAA